MNSMLLSQLRTAEMYSNFAQSCPPIDPEHFTSTLTTPNLFIIFFLFFCFLLIQTHAVQIAVRKEANTKNINVNGSGDKKTKQAYSTKK